VTARDEQGSIIIALAVILVLSGLSLAVLARTVSALASARLAQDDAAAVRAADSGVTDALYVMSKTGALSGSTPAFSWSAVLASPTAATVTSTGTVNGRSHVLAVKVRRRREWRWVLATSGSMVLDGSIHVDPTAVIATGGQLVERDGTDPSPDGSRQSLLGPGASCSGCSNPVPAATGTALPDPVLPSPTPQPPPGGCNPITALPSGTWYCPDTAVFAPGLVTVGSIAQPPVELYVEATGSVPATVTLTGSQPAPSSGDAGDFVIHVVGPGVINLDGSRITGVIDAPHSSLRSASCQFSLTGAADLGSVDCVTATSPTPQVTLDYDPSLAGVLSPVWRATTYGDSGS
jgi:hypothetical protein